MGGNAHISSVRIALWEAMHAFSVGAPRCGRRCTHFQRVHRAVGGGARIFSRCIAPWEVMHAFSVGAPRCGRRCTHFQWVRGSRGALHRALSFFSGGCRPLWWRSAGAVIFFWWVRGRCTGCRVFSPVGAGRCGGAVRALSLFSGGRRPLWWRSAGAVIFFWWAQAAVVARRGALRFFSSGRMPLWACSVGPVRFFLVGAGRCGPLRSAPGAGIPGYPAQQLQSQITRATGLAKKSGVYAAAS